MAVRELPDVKEIRRISSTHIRVLRPGKNGYYTDYMADAASASQIIGAESRLADLIALRDFLDNEAAEAEAKEAEKVGRSAYEAFYADPGHVSWDDLGPIGKNMWIRAGKAARDAG